MPRVGDSTHQLLFSILGSSAPAIDKLNKDNILNC